VIEPLLEAERLLLHRQVDAAERLYREVLERDPRNSVAVVGLARIALEREDDRGALDLARRALELDPNNLPAASMARRLEEVLRFRGESTEPR
jgi:predicted Zn-dependent protease